VPGELFSPGIAWVVTMGRIAEEPDTNWGRKNLSWVRNIFLSIQFYKACARLRRAFACATASTKFKQEEERGLKLCLRC